MEATPNIVSEAKNSTFDYEKTRKYINLLNKR